VKFIQSDHKITPQFISFLFEIRFQRAVHQVKGFKKYYKLDTGYKKHIIFLVQFDSLCFSEFKNITHLYI
jgi:hypothetical protein